MCSNAHARNTCMHVDLNAWYTHTDPDDTKGKVIYSIHIHTYICVYIYYLYYLEYTTAMDICTCMYTHAHVRVHIDASSLRTEPCVFVCAQSTNESMHCQRESVSFLVWIHCQRIWFFSVLMKPLSENECVLFPGTNPLCVRESDCFLLSRYL